MSIKKISTFTLSGIIALSVFALIPSQAFACSCVAGVPQSQAFEKAEAVFSGKVVSVDLEKNTISEMMGFSPSYKRVKIALEKSWKGVGSSTAEVMVATGEQSASCGYDFKEGKQYLVYAHDGEQRFDTNLAVGLCGRTTELSSEKAQADLKILGEGVTPLSGEQTGGQVQTDTNVNGGGFFTSIWHAIVNFFSF